MRTAQLVLTCSDLDVAKSLMQPLVNTVTDLRPKEAAEDAEASIEWGAAGVQRGAFENIITLLGQLDVVGFGTGIIGGLISSWIWERLPQYNAKKDAPKSQTIKLSILRGETYIALDLTSPEALEASIRAALDDDNPTA